MSRWPTETQLAQTACGLKFCDSPPCRCIICFEEPEPREPDPGEPERNAWQNPSEPHTRRRFFYPFLRRNEGSEAGEGIVTPLFHRMLEGDDGPVCGYMCQNCIDDEAKRSASVFLPH
jgi:hypothetical protein